MSDIFRPMLACAVEGEQFDKLRFPLLASPKLDGIRAVVRNGVVMSRSNKPIPNRHVQELFSSFEGYDGELIVGEATDEMVFRRSTSAVMSEHGKPDVTFYVFDNVLCPDLPYHQRRKSIESDGPVKRLLQYEVTDLWELDYLEEFVLGQGYEGLILRDPLALYKNGRSTFKEGALLKVKRFVDTELPIIGVFEEMANNNSATVDERGYTKRSSHQENKQGKGVLGGVIVDWHGQELRIGSGFTAAERAELWDIREALPGKLAKFKYFPVGGYDLPRHPVWLGLRASIDK